MAGSDSDYPISYGDYLSVIERLEALESKVYEQEEKIEELEKKIEIERKLSLLNMLNS